MPGTLMGAQQRRLDCSNTYSLGQCPGHSCIVLLLWGQHVCMYGKVAARPVSRRSKGVVVWGTQQCNAAACQHLHGNSTVLMAG